MALTTAGQGRLLAAFVAAEGPLTVGLQGSAGELHAAGYRRQPYGNGRPQFGPALKQPWQVNGVMLFGRDGATLSIEPIGPISVQPGQAFKATIEWTND